MQNKVDKCKIKILLKRDDGFSLDCTLDFPQGGSTVVFGQSGSGKTTLLRCIAGLERGYGYVEICNEIWQDDQQNIFLPTWERPLGYVFQEASLFPHLTALKNIQFAAKRAKNSLTADRVEVAISLLGIGHLLNKMPDQLSGGERQRVAIARAIATSPKILLFDEPLASLDETRKNEILPWLDKVRNELEIPLLYVTHSINELTRMADYLLVLEQGRLKYSGSLQDAFSVINLPVDIQGGLGTVLRGQVIKRDDWNILEVKCGNLIVNIPDAGQTIGQPLILRLLARDILLATSKPSNLSAQNILGGTVEKIFTEENETGFVVQVNCSGQPILAKVTDKAMHDMGLKEGMKAWILFKSSSVLLS